MKNPHINNLFMQFLVIGLGSMGKRRIRCLKRLGFNDIIGYDIRGDRREFAKSKYNIRVVDKLTDNLLQDVDVMIISTPPDKHNEYIKLAIDYKKPAFVEANVILNGLEELNELAKKKNVFIAPSCTLRFHPAIKEIKNIVRSKMFGKITNFTYHCGQYLPDWHPWEDIRNFYVSKRETSGSREMVAFELTWITDVVGYPKKVIGFYGKTIDLGVDIDDTYVIILDFGMCYGAMTIDVVSRYAIRTLLLNMEYGQIQWRWDENVVRLYDAINQRWIHYYYPQGQTVEGYNKNIIEDMYVDELKSFIDAIEGKGNYPHTLDDDIKILKLLYKLEGKI